MNRITQIASLVITVALAGCSDDSTERTGDLKSVPAAKTVSLRCSRELLTSSYSFELGKATSEQEADINFYFDEDDCSQGALFGQEDSKGYLFPVGNKTWDELSSGNVPQVNSESVVGFRPIGQEKEGLAFWVKTKSNRHVLVRIKSVQPAAFSDLASGDTAEVELEWTWGFPGTGSK